MPNIHKGNTQPAIDQEEHIHISNTAGKKSFIIDNADNQITDFGGNYKDPILQVSAGSLTGVSHINKFGQAADFDTADSPVAVWDGANDGGINAMTYTYSATANIDTISSSDNGDTQVIEIQGLDTSFNLVTQTKTLTGQTKAVLDTSLIRVFRMINTGTTNNAGDVYCYVDGDITLGVPDTAADVRAVILAGNNQTLMSIYTIPAGKTGYVTNVWGSLAGALKTATYDITFRARPTGEVFQIKHIWSLNDATDSEVSHAYTPYNKFLAKTDIEITVGTETGGVLEAKFSAGFDIILVDD